MYGTLGFVSFLEYETPIPVSEPPFDYVGALISQREAIIAAIQDQGGLDLSELGEPTQHGEYADFFSLCGLTFEGITLGFKRYRADALQDPDSFVLNIATLAFIGRQPEEYCEMLPRVHYELIGEQSSPAGVLTEDFSRHGKRRHQGSTLLHTLPNMFINPDVIDDTRLMHVIGKFGPRPEVAEKKLMHTAPIYDPITIRDGETGELAVWFVEEIGLDDVTSRIDGCQIDCEEIKPVS